MVDAVTLPDKIALDVPTGRLFQTTITALGSGREHRNTDWPLGRFQADIGLVAMEATDARTVADFFYAVQGRARSFYWKDKLEYIGTDEAIGTGDNSTTAFQIYKNHSNGVTTYQQPIKYLVSGSLTVELNGTPTVLFSESAGVITFNSAPGAGVAITASFQYYIPVRFDTDALNCQQMGNGLYKFPDLKIVEVIE